MDLNRFIFPAPSSSYTPFTLGQLLWIPRTRFFSMKTLIKMDSFENYFISGKHSHRPSHNGKKGTFLLKKCINYEYGWFEVF